MKPYEELLLKLIRSSVLQSEEDFSEFSDFEDWGSLFTLCSIHSVVGMTYDKLVEQFGDRLPEKYAIWFKHSAFKEMSFQAVRSLSFMSFYQRLKEADLAPVILKGEVLRSLYPKPESRTSLDEDFLIDESKYEALTNELTNMGFEEVMQGDDDKHWFNKNYSVYFEVHTAPFPAEKSFEKWNMAFDGYQDKTIVNDNGIISLSREDNLVFLILHAAKHFIYSGVGIKQIVDIALFMREYGSEINMKRVRDTLKKVKAYTFASEITAFIKKYIYPDTYTFGSTRLGDDFVQDILKSGSLGKADKDRIHSANLTSSAFIGRSSLKKILFAPKDRLQQQYPFAKKHPILLPVAWFLRLVTNIPRSRKVLQTGGERLRMIKKYGLIIKEDNPKEDK